MGFDVSDDASFADDLKARDAASNDNVEGRPCGTSSECLAGNAVSTPGDCVPLDETSLLVCVSHCNDGVPAGLVPESNDPRGGVLGVVGTSVEEPAPWMRRSFDDNAVQANVAALLAPGPSGLLRINFPVFSVVRVVRRVVRIGRFSGARGLGGGSCCLGIAGALRVASESTWGGLFMAVVFGEKPGDDAVFSPGEFFRNERGLDGAAGLDSSGYVIAGTVPWPIQPRSEDVERCSNESRRAGERPGEEEAQWGTMPFSMREIRRA